MRSIDNKKTIIYFGGFELPDKNAAAQRVISISKSLRDMGYKVDLYGSSKNLFEADRIVTLENNLQDIIMREQAYPRNIKQWIKYLIMCQSQIRIIEKYSDIAAIICYNYPALPLWGLNQYCKRKGIKLIADVTEWYDPPKMRFPLNHIKNIDTKLRMEFVQTKLNNIICISKYIYEYYNSKVSNCVLIPGTIDKNDEKWTKLSDYVPNTPFTLGYAGDPSPKCAKERIDLLISAVCELYEEGFYCHLKMAGFEQSLFELDYPEIVNKPYYKDCIHYLGKLSHQDCLQLIKNVDFTIIAREDKRVTRAGFPTKLSESFACGTPVITTPSSNIADYIINGANGFVTDGFLYEDIKRCINRAICIPRERLLDMHRITMQNNPLEYKQFTVEIKKLIDRSAIG